MTLENTKFKVGHYSNCSVILCPRNTIGSCYSVGSSTGSREIDLLSPQKKVDIVNAILLTGCSAYGLKRADGVMKFLKENNIGYQTPFAVVPIVPSAVIYDLGVVKIEPQTDDGYMACLNASHEIKLGKIGAGLGATIGKWAGFEYKDEGGLGFYCYIDKEVFVCSICVVNSVGDIIDKDGKVIKGANKNGHFLALDYPFKFLKFRENVNTTLVCILTNAKLTKLDCYKVSKRAVVGISRSIDPPFTSYDGDIIFTLSTNEVNYDFESLVEIVNFVVSESIRSIARS